MNIYPNRLLSLDMGNHSYKYVEAQLLSSGDFKIQCFGSCKNQILTVINPPEYGEGWNTH